MCVCLKQIGNMGNAGSTDQKSKPTMSNLMINMTTKYGENCGKYVERWSNEFGFPSGGSLSQSQLTQLRGKLESKRKGMLKEGKKKVKVSDVTMMDEMDDCLKLWEKGSEEKERKRSHKMITCVKVSEQPVETPKKTKRFSLYPSLQGAWRAYTNMLLDSAPI